MVNSKRMSGVNHPGYGIPRSEEKKARISASTKCKSVPQETSRRSADTRMKNGYHHSEETKKKIGRKGRVISVTTRQAVAEANRIRVYTPEMRQRRSEAAQKMWAARKGIEQQ